MNIRVSAAIVLYQNDIQMLKEAMNSFLSTDLDVHLFLVDNSPSDDLKVLKTEERISYVHNPSNPGFGASHNVAIDQAIEFNADYHLVLNPDIYFENGVIEELVEFMEENKSVGHVMPKVLYPDGELQYLCKQNPTFFDMFARGFMPARMQKLFQRRLDAFEYKNQDYDEMIYDVPYLSGSFMFLRVSTLKEVGYFDDRIFMYLEDADLTRRFLKVSRTVYYPKVMVYHHFAKLTHKKLKFKWITVQSAFTYFNKWGWLKSIV